MRFKGAAPAAFAVHFAKSPANRKALIQHVYAGPYHAEVHDVRPSKVATALLARVFR